MDITTLFNLSYGLYIIGAKDGDRNVGCVVNTVTQSTSNPVTLTVCINKDNYTNGCIKKTKEFAVSILSERTKESTFGTFGFSSSKDRDKFSEVPCGLTPSGQPYVNEGVTGYIQCKVIDFVDNYTHTLFIAEVQEAENLFKEPPMTYAYYHKVVKGKTAKNAPTYVADAEKTVPPARFSYLCDICQYAYPGDKEEFINFVGDYHCPICKADKSKFAEKAVPPAHSYVCDICRYEYPGSKEEFEKLPEDYQCPICRAAKGKFTKS
jgi:flavin reductase (DIM6/NTAB) family NADH-FMN oxidoreductase RutF/rubredoxin